MKKNLRKALKKQKGITLVALVITIVILIILATVAINFAFGNNGLINRAEDAKKYYANDTAYTEEALSNVESYIDGIIGENGGSGPEEPGTPTTVEEAKKNESKFDKTTTIKDGQDNSVVIPGGFHVDKDSGTNVEDGIVIEDDIGNQFVWIPVGEYKVSATISSTGKLTNNLARRSWGAKDVVQEPQEVTGVDTAITSVYNAYYAEDTTKYTSVAKDTIGAFKTSAITKGGFYIGRYEAGTENERTSKSDPLTTPLVQANKNAYVYVTRDQAKAQAEAMYSGNKFVKSELISSYAWDTALNFICQNSEYGYKLATTTDKTYGNIYTFPQSNIELTGAYKADKYSNICDVLGNANEWTTEFSNNSSYPCVIRARNYNYSDGHCAAVRSWSLASASLNVVGFRTQLYIKLD